MPTLDPRTLQLADIVITDASNLVSHCGIVAGTSRVNTPGGIVNRADMIYHATTKKGVSADPASTWASERGKSSVFRCKTLRFLSQGGKPSGTSIAEAAVALSTRCTYGKGRAWVKSWTGSSDYGASAKGRVAKYLQRLGAGGPFVTELYCSEYVVLAYQLAARGDENAGYFIDLDGKHTLPKDLRNWLLSRTRPGGTWSYLGELE
ncbi:hypothetical protein J5Y09_14720 [Roseomonas sp. PWR1]|uniref:Uncharacterized protein n=1 Tax=Roseomonas nitratireducens TaxID=2820810 RepID=A0ABS4AWM9_9PROT|nr:hypothetical protein [Neoroseomonas nitratireducens]MBP0465176.1 hypothetical protein [Neoroseomonas nitratireducens]